MADSPKPEPRVVDAVAFEQALEKTPRLLSKRLRGQFWIGARILIPLVLSVVSAVGFALFVDAPAPMPLAIALTATAALAAAAGIWAIVRSIRQTLQSMRDGQLVWVRIIEGGPRQKSTLRYDYQGKARETRSWIRLPWALVSAGEGRFAALVHPDRPDKARLLAEPFARELLGREQAETLLGPIARFPQPLPDDQELGQTTVGPLSAPAGNIPAAPRRLAAHHAGKRDAPLLERGSVIFGQLEEIGLDMESGANIVKTSYESGGKRCEARLYHQRDNELFARATGGIAPLPFPLVLLSHSEPALLVDPDNPMEYRGLDRNTLDQLTGRDAQIQRPGLFGWLSMRSATNGTTGIAVSCIVIAFGIGLTLQSQANLKRQPRYKRVTCEEAFSAGKRARETGGRSDKLAFAADRLQPDPAPKKSYTLVCGQRQISASGQLSGTGLRASGAVRARGRFDRRGNFRVHRLAFGSTEQPAPRFGPLIAGAILLAVGLGLLPFWIALRRAIFRSPVTLRRPPPEVGSGPLKGLRYLASGERHLRFFAVGPLDRAGRLYLLLAAALGSAAGLLFGLPNVSLWLALLVAILSLVVALKVPPGLGTLQERSAEVDHQLSTVTAQGQKLTGISDALFLEGSAPLKRGRLLVYSEQGPHCIADFPPPLDDKLRNKSPREYLATLDALHAEAEEIARRFRRRRRAS